MGPHVLLLATALASAGPRAPAAKKPPPPPPTEIAVQAAGATATGTLRGKGPVKFRMVATEKGTAIVSIEAIHGPAPRALIRNDEGKVVRRADRRGKMWARPAAGSVMILELSPQSRDAGDCTFQLTVTFDVDRPRPLRLLPRPARPRDIIRLAVGSEPIDQVLVGGVPAEHTSSGTDVLVTIPAFARDGAVELHYDSRPPVVVHVELIGTEPPRTPAGADDLVTDACAADMAGCLEIQIAPSIGSAWLAEIARLVDADVTRHIVKTGAVELKLRIASSESLALEMLEKMPGVRPLGRKRR